MDVIPPRRGGAIEGVGGSLGGPGPSPPSAPHGGLPPLLLPPGPPAAMECRVKSTSTCCWMQEAEERGKAPFPPEAPAKAPEEEEAGGASARWASRRTGRSLPSLRRSEADRI